MIVRLTHAQGMVVMERVPELHATRMREHRTAYGRTQHNYTLPAIGWRQVLDTLLDTAYGPLGGRVKDERPSLYKAIGRIQEEVSRLEHHPALTGRAVIGVQPIGFPCWRYNYELGPEEYVIYPPFGDPVEWPEFGHMSPHLRSINGQNYTEWVWHRGLLALDSVPYEYREESHLEFVTTP